MLRIFIIVCFVANLSLNSSLLTKYQSKSLISTYNGYQHHSGLVSSSRLNESFSQSHDATPLLASSSSSLPAPKTTNLNYLLHLIDPRLESLSHFAFEFSVVSILLLLTGMTSGLVVNKAKDVLVILEKYRVLYRYQFPLLGGIIVSLIYSLNKDLASSGPAVLFLNKVFFTKHLLRIVAVVVSVGFGNSLAFVGIAAEIGMTIGRFYLAIVFQFLEKCAIIPVKDLMSLKAKLILLICAGGAGAGVAANFDAPISGACFALEV